MHVWGHLARRTPTLNTPSGHGRPCMRARADVAKTRPINNALQGCTCMMTIAILYCTGILNSYE